MLEVNNNHDSRLYRLSHILQHNFTIPLLISNDQVQAAESSILKCSLARETSIRGIWSEN